MLNMNHYKSTRHNPYVLGGSREEHRAIARHLPHTMPSFGALLSGEMASTCALVADVSHTVFPLIPRRNFTKLMVQMHSLFAWNF